MLDPVIRPIPLDRLELSSANVRKTRAGKIALAELKAVVKLPPARRSGSVAGVTGACVCDGSGVKWPRVG